MVLRGSGTRFIGDNVQAYTPGNITFKGPNLPHLWRSYQDTAIAILKNKSDGIVVYFNAAFIGESLLPKEEALRIRSLSEKSLRGLEVTGKTRKIAQKRLSKLLVLKGFDSVLQLLSILDLLLRSDELIPFSKYRVGQYPKAR